MNEIKIERTVQGWTVFVDGVAQQTFDDPERANQEVAWLKEEHDFKQSVGWGSFFFSDDCNPHEHERAV